MAFPVASTDPRILARTVLDGGGRALLAGEVGSGKSTLVAALADALVAIRGGCAAIGADPGQPAFGPPAALALALREGGAWRPLRVEGIATLDAGRYRLPLVEAFGLLVRAAEAEAPGFPLLVDAPGLHRGIAAAELLPALARAAGAGIVLVLCREGGAAPEIPELRAIGAGLRAVPVHPLARRDPDAVRVRRRTSAWRAWLAGATTVALPRDALPVVGSPPPPSLPSAWPGRVAVVLGQGGGTVTLGEVVDLGEEAIVLRAPPFDPASARALCVRDARVDARRGILATDPGADEVAAIRRDRAHDGARRRAFTPREVPEVPVDLGPPPLGRRASVTPTLVNGLFGDPLLHLRVTHERRSLLFDLGEAHDLPARLAHQVSDACVTHAHLDHFSGFAWLLRARVGVEAPCRVFGPPGMAERVEAQVRAFTWNLVGEQGPRFRVGELHGGEVRWFDVQAGRPGPSPAGISPAPGGLLLEDAAFRIRAVTLDHRTPVLAFALEEARHLAVRRERLEERGWPPGPWLGELKRAIARGEREARIPVPGGDRIRAGDLEEDLLIAQPGQKLAYATDLADTPENRRALVELARGADLLICEASFVEEDAARARETYHLTARACGEIAAEAGVFRLVPFHFSSRYESRPEDVYAEVLAAFPRTRIPTAIRERLRLRGA